MSRGRVAALLAVVVALGVAARTAVAARGWFYWDDLTLHSQAREHDAPGPALLLTAHDGHLMPGAWLIEWLLATYLPLNWPAAVATLVVLQLVAAAAVAWACFVLCPRALCAVPLVLYLATPLTLPSTTWLAAAVNALPLHAATALVLAHAVLAVRGPHVRRHLLLAVLALVAGLLFSERVLFTGPTVVLALICLAVATGSLRRAGRRIARVAVALAVPTLAWAGVYLAVVGDPRAEDAAGAPVTGPAPSDPGGVVDLFTHGYLRALLPTAAGGPWEWERWHPGPPWADPGPAAVVAGAVAVVGVAVWTVRQRPRHLVAWLPTLLHPLLPLSALAFARTGPETAVEITQTLRHLSEVAVIAALTLAFLLARGRTRRNSQRAAGALLALVLVSSAVSTASYARVWAEQPARDYFHTLLPQLAERGEPIFDQAVDLNVLLPVVHPHNRLVKLVGGMADVPPFERWTTHPVLVDGDGNLVPAELVALRSTDPGAGPETEPGCGTRVGPEGATLELDGPLVQRDWVLQFNYFADEAGTVSLALDDGPVEIPVEAGLAQVHVSLPGGGERLHVTPGGRTSELCVGQGHIGLLAVVEKD